MLDRVQIKTQHRILLILLPVLSILSGVLVFFATANGPWGYSDSVAYIVSARNLIKGLGLGLVAPSGRFVITYLHPPLYPLLLSGIGIWGIDLVDAARWCNIVLCVVTVFTTGWIFLRYSYSPSLSILASFLTVFFPATLVMFTSSMSEPLFLALFCIGSFLLLSCLQNKSKPGFFVAALFMGLLPVSRYVGIAILFSAVLCVYLFSTGSWHERLKRSFVFGLIASLPLIIWLAVLYFGPGQSLGGRSIHVDGEYLADGFQSYRSVVVDILWGWIPFSQRSIFQSLHPFRGIILIVMVLVISAITWFAGLRLTKKGKGLDRGPDIQLSTFFGVGSISYFLVSTITWLFTVPQTPINDRLLMPIYFGTVLWVLSCWSVWRRTWFSSNALPVRSIPWLLAVVMIYWYYPQMMDVLSRSYRNDTIIAYRWRDSQVMHALSELPASQPVISNESAAVMMWADHPAFDLLDSLESDFIKQNLPYGSDDTDALQSMFKQGAVLVVFNDFPSQFEAVYGKRGKERLKTIFDGLVVIGQYPEGTIYLYPAN